MLCVFFSALNCCIESEVSQLKNRKQFAAEMEMEKATRKTFAP